jgi:hypothetical protein
MPKFDAGAVVEPLDYDFTTVRGYPHRKARGTIAEPNDEKIAAFIASLRDMMQAAGSIVGDGGSADIAIDPTAFLGQLDSYDPEKLLGVFRGLATTYADLCSGQPSAEEIMDLPLRVRVRFFAWLQQEVVSPEAGTGAGMAVVTQLRPAVAG